MAARVGKKVLTPEAFGKFLRWLSEDDGLAVREYQTIRTKLVRYFVCKGCLHPDELFDETVDILVGKIEECAECPNPLAYCYGVAKNVWRQYNRQLKPVTLSGDIPSRQNQEGEMREQESRCLERCLDQLSPRDRDLISQYHQSKGREKIEARKLQADDLGGINALRVRACRIRKNLHVCVVKCVRQSVN